MDARVGRFTGMDPFGGSIGDPKSLHRYFYGAANPINKIDPDGAAVSPAETLHDTVVLYVAADYELKHPGNYVDVPVQQNPNWEGLTPDVMDFGPAATSSGFFRNWGLRRWLEVKPLSYTGWLRSQESFIRYATLGSLVGAFPAGDWVPTNPVMAVGGQPLYIVNLGGTVFYTDSEQLYKEALVLSTISALGQIFTMAGSFTSKLTEFGEVGELATVGAESEAVAGMELAGDFGVAIVTAAE
jgi:hypothetical protein